MHTNINEINRYKIGFKRMQNWIHNDLYKSTILAHANLLVSMAIFNYIEILGSFYYPKGKSYQKFNFVINDLFPASYKKNIRKLRKYTVSPYDSLRCGFTHEYLPKSKLNKTRYVQDSRYVIRGCKDKEEYLLSVIRIQCGIIVNVDKHKKLLNIDIVNSVLIENLKYAFETFLKELDKNPRYVNKFVKRAREINFEKFCS